MSLTVVPFVAPNEKRVLTKQEALIISGQCLNMCYLKDDFEKIKHEPEETSLKRARRCIASGHHSGFEHVKYTFEISDISKMLAMILNSQGVYATSEKSGRYRVLDFDSEQEKKLRDKWQEIFYNILCEKYYEMFKRFYSKSDRSEEKNEKIIKEAIIKKAQENSRLITSPFAKTKMIYTINFRQLSYLRYELKIFINEAPNTPFYNILKQEMQEFIEATAEYGAEEEGLNPGSKNVKLPFFETVRERQEEFGENYSINYYVSFATFAQLLRHRTCHYMAMLPEEKQYFIPEFIKDNDTLVNEWINDCKCVTDESQFPQATLLYINERGRYEDFVLKAYERLCGATQYEATMVMKEQLDKYLDNVTSVNAREALEKIYTGARCTFGYKCTEPCMFGAKFALNRKF